MYQPCACSKTLYLGQSTVVQYLTTTTTTTTTT